MKKILIYLNKEELKPCGGPIGYNYNLFQEFKKRNISNIFYLNGKKGNFSSVKSVIDKIRPKIIRDIVSIIKSIINKIIILYSPNKNAVVNINQYDIIHFHSTVDIYRCKNDLKHYNGKVVLTSHSPTLPSKEMISYLSKWEQKHLMFFYKKLINIDRYAFNRADYIIFPCEEAEEPYKNNWNEYAKFKQKFHSKYRYLLTGIEPVKGNLSKSEIRSRYNIPENSFVICYVGRHNEIKGFDRLIDIGKELLKHNNIYFLVAGIEAPISGLKHPHWIEIGWTNDPYSYIAASDCFILPNRETYFDLVLLEVISLGKIVIASNTGGNKYFSKIDAKGIFTFSTMEEAVTILNNLMNMPYEYRKRLENDNISIYYKYFTSKTFADNYIKLINNL